jgi:hypothetical protein
MASCAVPELYYGMILPPTDGCIVIVVVIVIVVIVTASEDYPFEESGLTQPKCKELATNLEQTS